MSKTDKIPSHVAIIMDGNGRWARARGLERHEGHRAGVNSLRNVIARAARNPGVRYLTLYVFSTETGGVRRRRWTCSWSFFAAVSSTNSTNCSGSR